MQKSDSLSDHQFLSNPAARSLAATSLADDASSQHSSDQSDTRTEHSDEDVGEKAPKRATSVRTTKKPAAAKTEVGPVNTHAVVSTIKYSI